jgi:hypothetical protein
MSLDRKGCVVAPRKHKLPLNRHESDIRGSGLKSYSLQKKRFGYAGVPN